MTRSVEISGRIDCLNGLLADLTPYKVPRHPVSNDGKVGAAALLFQGQTTYYLLYCIFLPPNSYQRLVQIYLGVIYYFLVLLVSDNYQSDSSSK